MAAQNQMPLAPMVDYNDIRGSFGFVNTELSQGSSFFSNNNRANQRNIGGYGNPFKYDPSMISEGSLSYFNQGVPVTISSNQQRGSILKSKSE